MTVDDEKLMAYVDGELDVVERAALEAAIASDPELQRQVARQQALRARLRGAFDGVLDEPVPQRLLDLARSAPAGASVADLAQARSARSADVARRWALPQWAAMAASLVLGVLVGRAWLTDESQAMFATRDGALVAAGALASALERQLASSQPSDAPVQIGLSFRNRSNDYCRAFDTAQGAGLACKAESGWQVQVLARTVRDSAGGGYRMAAGQMPPAVLHEIEGSIQGEPLDMAAEAAAQRAGWR